MNTEQILIVCALCLPIIAVVGRNQDLRTTIFDNVKIPNIGNGKYFFRYENSDGTYRKEYGKYKTGKNKEPILTVTGSYSVLDDNGNLYVINYQMKNQKYNQTIEKFPKEEKEGKEEQDDDSNEITTRINTAALGALVGGGIG